MPSATVLLVDDDADSRAIYGAILRHGGYVVVEAGDPQQGFALAREGGAGLLVLEPFPLGPQRWDALRSLVEEPETACPPVLVVTVMARAVDRVAARAAGVAAYLDKPCTPARLLEEVRRLLPTAI